MSQPPWRNPRPAPQLSQMQGRITTPAPVSWIAAWWPALMWAVVIFFLSTDAFSAAHTGFILEPIIRAIYPPISAAMVERIHFFIRKSAHFTEYFIFCVLLFRAMRGAARGWRWNWALTALIVAAIYSALDEFHQSFVASRTASPYDSMLDSVGALFAVFALFLYFRSRTTARTQQSVS